MIALDTNAIVRLVTADHSGQLRPTVPLFHTLSAKLSRLSCQRQTHAPDSVGSFAASQPLIPADIT